LSEPHGDKSFERLLAGFLRGDLAPAGAACPAPGTAAAYYERCLSAVEVAEFEEHLAGCAGCQADIAALVRLDQETESAPASPTEAPPPIVAAAPPPAEVAPPPMPAEPVREAPPAEDRRVVEPPRRPRVLVDEVPPEPAKPAPQRPMPFQQGRNKQKRATWRWVAPLALAATIVIAVSVTWQLRPTFEQAARPPRESDGVSAQNAPIGGLADRDSNEVRSEDKRAPADLFDEQPAERADQSRPAEPPSSTFAAPQAGGGAAAGARAPAVAAPPPAPPPPIVAGRVAEPAPPRAAAAPEAETAKKAEAFRAKTAERPSVAPTLVPAPAAKPQALAAKQDAAPAPLARRPASGPVTVIARTNLDTVWRVGGGIERSDDAGKTWRPQMSSPPAALLTGSAPTAETCWVGGQGGVVLRTTDGEHWERVSSPTDEDILQVTAWNATSASVKTASGVRFSTNDAGKTWSRL